MEKETKKLQFGDRRRMAEEGHRKIILSTEEICILSTEMIGEGGESDWYIYAEHVECKEKLHVKNGLFALHSFEGEPFLSAAGADGKPASFWKQEKGESGESGGSLAMYLEEWGEGQKIKLCSDGGKGGDGTEGGAGGDGGEVTVLFKHPYYDLLERLDTIIRLEDGEEQKRQFYDFAGRCKKSPLLREYFQKIEEREELSQEDIIMAEQYILLEGKFWKDNLECSLKGGWGGLCRTEQAAGKNVKRGNGRKGNIHCITPFDRIDAMRQSTVMYAHPEQCEMLLGQIKMRFFVMDFEKSDEVYAVWELLVRLARRTEAFYHLPVDTPLAHAYQEEEKIGATHSVERLEAVWLQTVRFQEYLLQGLDYMGRKQDYVPLLSFQSYKNNLTDMEAHMHSIKELKCRYLEQEEKRERQRERYQSMDREYRDIREGLDEDIRILADRLKKTQNDILLYNRKMQQKKPELTLQMKRFEKAVKEHSGFELSKIISSMTFVAFAPESPVMWGAAGMEILVDADKTIEDNSGVSINRNYLTGRMEKLSLTLENLQEICGQQEDGELFLADPGGQKLLAVQEEIESIVRQVDLKLEEESEELRKSVEDFVQAVLERNQAVLSYNSIVGLIQKKQEEAVEAERRQKLLRDENFQRQSFWCQSDDGMVEELCQNAEIMLLDAYSLAVKSYAFWSLDTKGLELSDIFYIDGHWDLSREKIKYALMKLQDKYQKAVERSSVWLKGGQTVSVKLSREQLQDLQSRGCTVVPVTWESFERRNCDNPFTGMYDVRVSGVKVFLEGLYFAGENRRVRMTITQMGEERCMDQNGVWHSFSHEPCSTMFEYDAESGREIIDGSLEGKETGTWEEHRALVGPFARWRIQIERTANKKMDALELKGGRMEFTICFRTM